MRRANRRTHILLPVLCILIGSCSVPSLDTAECAEARNVVRRFYSFHLANDMHPSEANLTGRESFLTPELSSGLRKVLASKPGILHDYFTATDNYPKAFRVSGCTLIKENKATVRVLLFWRDDTASEQKEINVDVVGAGDRWLINSVE